MVNLANGTWVTPRAQQEAARWTLGRQFDHALLVLLENQNFDAVAAHPGMQALMKRGAVLSQYEGNFHPSYSNYLALVGGRYFGASSDNQMDIDVSVRSIADLLETKGLTWKQYAEGFPGDCFAGDIAGHYARKHVPFLSFLSVRRNPAHPSRCANVVPASQFDPNALPNFAFYTPDLCHDGHDACLVGKSTLDEAVEWVNGFLAPLLSNATVLRRTLIVVVFDESADYSNDHTFALLLGGAVKAGFRTGTCYDHYNLLRTIEDNFAIGDLGGEDQQSSPITSIWVNPGG